MDGVGDCQIVYLGCGEILLLFGLDWVMSLLFGLFGV